MGIQSEQLLKNIYIDFRYNAHFRYYACCPEPFPDVTFTLTFSRRVAPLPSPVGISDDTVVFESAHLLHAPSHILPSNFTVFYNIYVLSQPKIVWMGIQFSFIG